MNKKQENQNRMQLSVERVFDENQSAYQSIPALANAIIIFKANNVNVEKLRDKQKMPSKGYTEQRDNQKKEMAELALEVAGSVAAYAHKKSDYILAKKVDFSFSELVHARDAVVKSRVTIILNEAKTVIADLGDYGTDSAQLSIFEQKISGFSEIVGKKGYNKEETQTATEQIAEILSYNNELLKNFADKLIIKFKNSNPEFYKNYFNAREIYDFGGGKKGEVPEEAPSNG
jgi:hypothetical protein